MTRLGEPVLRVKKALWRRDDPTAEAGSASARGPEWESLRKKVLERDDHTCGHCGFRSEKWQEIHHKDDDHGNSRLENLETLCPWCHGCHHVGLMGVLGKARLVWCPEIPQTHLFHLVRTMGVAILQGKSGGGEGAEMGKKATEAYRTLFQLLGNPIRTLWGEDIQNPAMLGNLLLAAGEREIKEERLAGFRLLPDLMQWQPQVTYWASSVFGATPAGTWRRLAESWKAVALASDSTLPEDEAGIPGGDRG